MAQLLDFKYVLHRSYLYYTKVMKKHKYMNTFRVYYKRSI